MDVFHFYGSLDFIVIRHIACHSNILTDISHSVVIKTWTVFFHSFLVSIMNSLPLWVRDIPIKNIVDISILSGSPTYLRTHNSDRGEIIQKSVLATITFSKCFNAFCCNIAVFVYHSMQSSHFVIRIIAVSID